MTDHTTKPIYPPVFLAAALLAMVVAHFTLPVVELLRFPLTLIGLVPIAAGVVLNLVADRAFKRHGTTVKPFERSSTLMTTGVFGVSRNPMYLGMILLLVGVGLL